MMAETKRTVGITMNGSVQSETNQLIETPGTSYSSPSRKAKKQVNYAESDGEDDDDEVFKPLSGNGRAAKRRRISVKDESDDEFGVNDAVQGAVESDEGMFVSRHTRYIQHKTAKCCC